MVKKKNIYENLVNPVQKRFFHHEGPRRSTKRISLKIPENLVNPV
jgi:hypothetical protein